MELLRDEGIGGVIEAVPAGGPGNVLPMTGRDGGLRSSNTATEYQVRDTPPLGAAVDRLVDGGTSS